MTSQPIPDEDHISRYVSPRKIYKSQTGIRRAYWDTFLPRKDYPPGTGAEEYVSVDWLEYFQGNLRARLDQIRDVLIQVRSRTVTSDSAFAILNVGNVKAVGLRKERPLSVKTIDKQSDQSHSGIYGLTPEDGIIAKEIANQAEIENAW